MGWALGSNGMVAPQPPPGTVATAPGHDDVLAVHPPREGLYTVGPLQDGCVWGAW